MANFRTHLVVAMAASTALAVVGFVWQLFGFFEMAVFALIGAVGGLLPDIDLDHSKISQMVFNVASVAGATFLMFLYINYRTIDPIDAFIAWAVLIFIWRYGVFGLFSKLTVHRGAVHSVPYMAIISLLFVLFSHHFLQLSALLSWWFGIFLFFGSLVHLLLDELYSVNVYNLKLKKSFGTAFKFYEIKKPLIYISLYIILITLFIFSPSTNELQKLILPLIQAKFANT